MRKGKTLLQGGLLCAVALLILFAVLEVAVRIFFPQQETMRWMLPDTRYGHVMKPDFHQEYLLSGSGYVMDVKTNAQGLRDEEIVPFTEGQQTILFLGDSFTFGHGVEVAQRFDTLLDAQLNAERPPYRLINTGVQGWGTLQQSRYAQDHFEEFAPDIVVITFCRNDPSDTTYFLKKGQSFDAVWFPGKAFIRNHSHLYRLINKHAFVLLFRLYTREEKVVSEAPQAEAPPAKTSLAEHGIPITESDWKATVQHLQKFIAAFEAYNPAGRVLIQSTSPWLADTRRRLEEFTRTSPADHVDMFEPASKLSVHERHLPHDPHWSLKMQKMSAEALYGAITNLNSDK
jgi:lysophospholipase L1-like esterase